MRNSAVLAVRRSVLCALSCAALSAALPVASAAAPQPREASRVPFAARYQAVQHGGIVRAANSSAKGVKGTESANDGAAIAYVDVDSDPNTYNSSRAELAVPEGARVAWARLYWGGNLRVPLDGNGYDKASDGLLGVVAYGGDRGTSGDYLAVETSRRKSTRLSDSANSADDVMNSSITEFGAGRTVRFPDGTNTMGYDSDVFDLRGALRDGADRVHVRLGSRQDTVWLGALFLQADVRR
ncbi:hypothetical protein [Streptomyces exfoliatus]|uniref:hypothetical protein n=1 Tax=Streptomyces exfoliatus TaxID=1905 RepID=UPI0037872AE3